MDILFHLLYTWIPAGVYPDENRGRNDGKGPYPKFVSPAKAGVQCMGFKWARPPTDDVLTIMDPLVIPWGDYSGFKSSFLMIFR